MKFLWDALFENSKLPKSFHIASFIGDTLKLIHFERRIWGELLRCSGSAGVLCDDLQEG